MRYFIDFEFIEDGTTIDPISVGIAAEDGRTYYAEFSQCDLTRADEWVQANVLPHLIGEGFHRLRIAAEIIEFVGSDPEFWGYYADYDWVALCQLYGRMIDLPDGWPMFCRDVKQLSVDRGVAIAVPEPVNEHHALADALWAKAAYEQVDT